MAYDPQDRLLIVTNGSEAVPFAPFISVTKHVIVGKLIFKRADGGLEASMFDAETHRFYLSVPANKRNLAGLTPWYSSQYSLSRLSTGPFLSK